MKLFENILLSEHCDDKDMVKIHITTVNVSDFQQSNEYFWGACLDTGAQKNVICEPQKKAYVKMMGAGGEKIQFCVEKKVLVSQNDSQKTLEQARSGFFSRTTTLWRYWDTLSPSTSPC